MSSEWNPGKLGAHEERARRGRQIIARIINFTVKHLKPLLLNGKKTQTIRRAPYWMGVLNVGDTVQIWWNQRTQRGHKLFDATVTGLIPLYLPATVESVFLDDGFDSKAEALAWFEKVYRDVEQPFVLIQFQRHGGGK